MGGKGETVKKIIRLQWIQTSLNHGVSLNRRVLMDRFGIRKSTATSDFNFFRERNLISFDSVRHEYSIIDKFNPLPDLFISQKEWLALIISENILSQQSTYYSKEIAKLLSRYKEKMGQVLATDSFNRSISCCLTKIETIDEDIFQECVLALTQRMVLRIQYHKAYDNIVSQRIISPRHLVCQDGKWVLVSWDHDKNKLQNFMPSRINELIVEEELPYNYLDDACLDEHLNESYGLFKGKKIADAVLLFSEQLSHWADKQNWHPREKKEWHGKRLKLTLPIANETGILQEILSYGVNVEVLSPLSLREKTRDEIKKMSRIYEK